MVSNYFEYFKLSSYLRRHVRNPIGLVMGLNNLADIFKEEYYQCLDGGILEAFGVLFKDNVKYTPIRSIMKISNATVSKSGGETMWKRKSTKTDWLPSKT